MNHRPTQPNAVVPTNPDSLSLYHPDNFCDVLTIVALFARVLDTLGVFRSPSEAIDYFTQPWKWRPEYSRWIKLGAPLKPKEIIRNGNTILRGDS